MINGITSPDLVSAQPQHFMLGLGAGNATLMWKDIKPADLKTILEVAYHEILHRRRASIQRLVD